MTTPAFPAADENTRSSRDGCNCPPWIVRCAHFDGSWVVVHRAFARRKYFCVCKGNGLVSTGDAYYHTDSVEVEAWLDEVTALEAFHTAELQLLGRSDA